MTAKTVPRDSLLLKFRSMDSRFGVTRSTLRTLAQKLNVPETQVIHMALAQFAAQVIPADAVEEGSMPSEQIAIEKK